MSCAPQLRCAKQGITKKRRDISTTYFEICHGSAVIEMFWKEGGEWWYRWPWLIERNGNWPMPIESAKSRTFSKDRYSAHDLSGFVRNHSPSLSSRLGKTFHMNAWSLRIGSVVAAGWGGRIKDIRCEAILPQIWLAGTVHASLLFALQRNHSKIVIFLFICWSVDLIVDDMISTAWLSQKLWLIVSLNCQKINDAACRQEILERQQHTQLWSIQSFFFLLLQHTCHKKEYIDNIIMADDSSIKHFTLAMLGMSERKIQKLLWKCSPGGHFYTLR
jgi:hypothetical protein